MNDVDAYLCTYANSMCEVFMPFNKPLIVIAGNIEILDFDPLLMIRCTL
jgi:hypothetical protein